MNPTPPYTPPPGMPPLPRDHDQASVSEMVPFTSKKINLLKSPLTLFIAFAAVLAPLIILMADSMNQQATLPAAIKTFQYISFASVFFVIFAIALVIYFYTRPGRSLLHYAWAFVLIAGLMLITMAGIPFILDLFMLVFRALPFADPFRVAPNASVPEHFIAHYIGAGLMEELFKALPILIAVAVTMRAEKRPGPVSPLTNFFIIRSPLDGVLLGVFAGAAFILVETAGQYLPGQIGKIMNRGGDFNDGVSQALLLYFPRVIGGAIGHIAYSAIFGYFIALALLRRKQMLVLVIGGWLFASWLHALWNSAHPIDPSGNFFFVVAGLCALCLVAVVLKARQLHVSRFGDAGDTMGSLIIDRSGGGRDVAPAMPAYAGHPQPQPQSPYPGYAPAAPAPHAGYAPHPVAPPVQAPAAPAQPFAGYASNAGPAPAPVAPAPADVGDRSESVQLPLTLSLAGRRIDLDAGAVVDFAADPVLAVLGAGVRGDVVPHPSRPGVLGLRNSGIGAWTAYLRDGSSQRIDVQQNIRLAAGVRIDFGGGLTGDVVARG